MRESPPLGSSVDLSILKSSDSSPILRLPDSNLYALWKGSVAATGNVNWSSFFLMKMRYAFILGFLLVFVSRVCCSGEDVLGVTKSNPAIDVKKPGTVEKEKPGGIEKKLSPLVKDDKVIGVEGGLRNGSDASKDGLKKETGDGVHKSSVEKTQGNESEENDKKKIVENPKEGSKTNGETSGKPEPQGEECDLSNRCTDEGKTLVACLRVPGNDALDLSLLIQNKGKGTMVVKISVPTFVEVERTRVNLKEKENQKVKVSLKKGGKDGDIILSTGASSCSLNLKSLIANINGGEEVATLSKSKYLKVLTETKALSFMILVFVAVIASVGVWLSVRKRRHLSTIATYQKLDTELPISIGREQIANTSDVHNGWDNGWDDNWDDEEAPMSPMPVTPSISSKGLASRKLNKD